MLQFAVRSDASEATRFASCTKLPFTIGRSEAADFSLAAPGVWDLHAEIVAADDGRAMIRPLDNAIVLVNGQRSGGKVLTPGDELQLGAISLVVGLAPVRQKRLARYEGAFWLTLTAVVVAQIACILKLQ